MVSILQILNSIRIGITSVGVLVLLLQIIYYIPKIYRFVAYKNAENASSKYMDSRLLVGLKGKDVSEVVVELDEYLNDVIKVDLEQDELTCIVESKIYEAIIQQKGIDKIAKAIENIPISNTIVNETVNTNTEKDKQNEDITENEDEIIKMGDCITEPEEVLLDYDEVIGGESK